jgi:hypothetical protein
MSLVRKTIGIRTIVPRQYPSYLKSLTDGLRIGGATAIQGAADVDVEVISASGVRGPPAGGRRDAPARRVSA